MKSGAFVPTSEPDEVRRIPRGRWTTKQQLCARAGPHSESLGLYECHGKCCGIEGEEEETWIKCLLHVNKVLFGLANKPGSKQLLGMILSSSSYSELSVLGTQIFFYAPLVKTLTGCQVCHQTVHINQITCKKFSLRLHFISEVVII